MTFDEWKNENKLFDDPVIMNHPDFLKVVWREATFAERNACAELCDEVAGRGPHLQQAAISCAMKIRSR